MDRYTVERLTLYEEFRLIERNENDVSVAWKGAHFLLFFLAFVFGSLCCFCFHALMYMFDQKCVLFPKVVSHASLRQIVYEYFSVNADSKEIAPELPLNFVSIQWVDDSVCYLPTYVPLVSGLFGLIWTTMYLMCSSSTTNLTGMQRQWRAFPSIFVFSVAMGSVCIYTTAITHSGLRDLCNKLAEITGSTSCTYTVNVATLAYQRQIRGVYQATMLTIVTAWLHTSCWLLSALLTLIRVLFAVDFQLVRVRADLIGDVDRMLEKYERQVRSINPEAMDKNYSKDSVFSDDSGYVVPTREEGGVVTIDTRENVEKTTHKQHERHFMGLSDTIYMSQRPFAPQSEWSLVPEEQHKLARISAFNSVPRKHQFIVKLLYHLLDTMQLPELEEEVPISAFSDLTAASSRLSRQKGQEHMGSESSGRLTPAEAMELAKEVRRQLRETLTRETFDNQPFESSFNLTAELKNTLEAKEKEKNLDESDQTRSEDLSEPSTSGQKKKSNLKSKSAQTNGHHKVQLLDSVRTFQFDSTETDDESSDTDNEKKKTKDQDTQTTKEKQD